MPTATLDVKGATTTLPSIQIKQNKQKTKFAR